MFLKYYCELNYNCVHWVKLWDLVQLLTESHLSKTHVLVYFYKYFNTLHSERSEARICFTAIEFHFDLEGARRK